MNAPIGVFDSGVGGLTVAREIMRSSEESMIFWGYCTCTLWNEVQRYDRALFQTDRQFSVE